MARKLHTLQVPALRPVGRKARLPPRVVFAQKWYAPHCQRFCQWIRMRYAARLITNAQLLRTETEGAIRGYVSLREANDTDARIGLMAGRSAGGTYAGGDLLGCQGRGKAACGCGDPVRRIAAKTAPLHTKRCQHRKHCVLVIQVTT